MFGVIRESNKSISVVFLSILFSSFSQAANVELPVYGNWCGFGHPAKGESPTPIDSVDKACMVHDNEYLKCATGNDKLMCEAKADLALVDTLQSDLVLLSQTQLFAAKGIGHYFVMQGTMKALADMSNELFVSRLKIASQLRAEASLALSDVHYQLNHMKKDFARIANITADQFKQMIDEFKKRIDSTHLVEEPQRNK